jgi:hypothetical protein
MAGRWHSVALIASLGVALGIEGDAVAARRNPTPSNAPRVVLWAWEEPEDLRTLDPRETGVAFLADRLFLGNDVRTIPRRERILVPDGAWAEAVVRMEATPDFADSEALRAATTQQLLQAAALPGIRSLQIDFDATESQRVFYAEILRRVRAGLPAQVGLTITALVDEAVPMYFRLGKHVGRWQVREPLCADSLGLSTDELALSPGATEASRLYLFAPRPWTPHQLALVNRFQLPVALKGGR